MAENTRIEWAHDTVNPWWGCTKVSPACTHCYAETMDRRGLVDGGGHWGPKVPRFIRVDKAIAELDRIARKSDRQGAPRRVFIASMADVFEDRADLVEPRKRLWDHLHLLGRRITPLLLTKRPEVMVAWAKEHGWPDGAWAGTTVEDQKRADVRIPHLLQVPAEVRFLSCEPLLGPVRLDNGETSWLTCDRSNKSGTDEHVCCMAHAMTGECFHGVDWVIAGGESGGLSRPSHPDWFRSLRDQCVEAGVAYHFKQHGDWIGHVPKLAPGELLKHYGRDATPWLLSTTGERFIIDNERWEQRWFDYRDHTRGRALRVGKKRAGRRLDGRTWDQVPEVTP